MLTFIHWIMFIWWIALSSLQARVAWPDMRGHEKLKLRSETPIQGEKVSPWIYL